MKRSPIALAQAFVLALLLLGLPASQAATNTWVGGTNGVWDTATANWNNGTGTVAWGSAITNVAAFAGSDGSYTVNLAANVTATNLWVSNSGYVLTAAGAQTLTLSTDSGSFGSTNKPFPVSSSLWIAPGKTFTIGTNVTVALNASNTGFSATAFLGGAGTTGTVLNIDAGGALVRTNGANGVIRFSGTGTVNVAGTMAFTSGGGGGVMLNSYTNEQVTVNVNSGGQVNSAGTGANQSSFGAIVINNAGAGASGTLNVNSGGTVSATYATDANGGIMLSRGAGGTGTVNINGGGTVTAPRFAITAGTGVVNLNGGTLRANMNNATNFMPNTNLITVNVNTNSTFDNGGYNVTIQKGMAGAAGLTFAGSGITTLSGTNTYAGATAVSAGRLAVNGLLASAITVSNGATFNGSGTNSSSLTMNAGSTLLANTTGGAFKSSGGVTFAGLTALLFNGATTVGSTYDVISYGSSLSGFTNLVPTYRATLTDDTVNAKITATAGTNYTSTWSSGSGTWIAGATMSNAGDNLYYNGDAVVFGNSPSNSTVTLSASLGTLLPASVAVDATNDYTFSGAGTIGGTASLSKTNSGAAVIATANSYSGGTALNAGKLVVNNAAALGTGPLTINGGTLDSTAGVSLSGNITQNWNGDFSFAGSSDLNMGNGVVTLSGNRSVDVAAGNLTVGRLVNTTGGLTKTGAGALTLNPTAAGNLAGTLNVAGGALYIGSQDLVTLGLAGSGILGNGSGTTRWLIVTNNSDNTFSGSLQDGAGAGRLGFSKRGTGTTTLSGTNNYSDRTSIFDGGTLVLSGQNLTTNIPTYYLEGGVGINSTLKLASANAIGTNAQVRFNSGSGNNIVFASDGGDSSFGLLMGTGTGGNIVLGRATAGAAVDRTITSVPFQGIGGGTINFTQGANVTSGTSGITFTQFGMGAGTVQTTTLNPVGVNVTLGEVNKFNNNVSQTLELGGTSAGNQVIGNISNGAPLAGTNAISITKSGSGTWTLSGTNTYTGATTVNAGKLVINGNNAGATGAVSVGVNGTLGGSGTIGGATTIAGTHSPGNSPGLQTFTNSLTYSGGSSIIWELAANGIGTRGTDFDGINVGGALSFAASPVTMNLTFNQAGSAVDWTSAFWGETYSGTSGWLVYSGATSLSGFGNLALNGSGSWVDSLSQGLASFHPDAAFSLYQDGNNVYVNYTVPEPSTYALLAMGGLAMGGYIIRRRRR